MRYTYDTEFLEDGKTIELISIGIVNDKYETYYAVNADMPIERIEADPWLMKHVWPSLPHPEKDDGDIPHLDFHHHQVKPKWVIRNEVQHFLLGYGKDPELWANYAAYDHVALAQLWGKMIDLPDGMPMFTNDIQQAIRGVKGFKPPRQSDGEHNALEDARHNLAILQALDAARKAV